MPGNAINDDQKWAVRCAFADLIGFYESCADEHIKQSIKELAASFPEIGLELPESLLD